MAICEICNKGINSARKISITRSQVSRRAKVKPYPNVKKVKAVVDGVPKTVKACTSCIRNGAVKFS